MGGSIGSQAWESGADLLLANGIPGGDFRLHGLVCPHPKSQPHERSPSPMPAWLSSELTLRACPLNCPRSPDSDLLWPLLSDLWNQDVDMASSGSVALSWRSPVWWVGARGSHPPVQPCCHTSPRGLLCVCICVLVCECGYAVSKCARMCPCCWVCSRGPWSRYLGS